MNHDEQGQAVLINLLLRNHLQYNENDLAYNLVAKTEFPENSQGNEIVRFLYYIGRIKAVRGEYADSLSRLTQSLRKAPDNSAFGFKVTVMKLSCLVELLLGEIPSRETFAQDKYKAVLYPYYAIVSSVIKGNLKEFQEFVRKYESIFIKDKNYNIIQR